MTTSGWVPFSWVRWLEPLRPARWLWLPLLAFTITRLSIAMIAYFSTPILTDSSVPPYHIFPNHTLLDVFTSRWDTGFYLSIAETGYRYEIGRMSSVAFFPLMPILMRGASLLVGSYTAAGLIISNLSLLGASIMFYWLAANSWGSRVAERAVWYLLVFPTSFFGSAIYSESLFLLLAILALFLARRGRWGGAAMAGILATLTRFMGIIVFPMLAVEWFSQHKSGPEGSRPHWSGLASTALVPLGTGVYMLYLKLVFGDALAFLHASTAWGREPVSPLGTIAELLQRPMEGWGQAIAAGRLPLDNWVDFFFVIVFLALGVTLLAKRQWSEGVFVLMGTLIPFSSGLLMSQRRYVWVLFPAFILLAQWGEKSWFDRLIMIVSLMGLGLFTAMFANWYWVG